MAMSSRCSIRDSHDHVMVIIMMSTKQPCQAWGPQTSVEDIFDSVQSALRDADTVVQVQNTSVLKCPPQKTD